MRKLSLFALAAVAFLGITGSANQRRLCLRQEIRGISSARINGYIATTVFFLLKEEL